VPSIEQLAIECWLGRGDAGGIAAWCAGLDPSDPATELRSLNSVARIDAFREVARDRCGYPPCTAEGSAAAVVVLQNLCGLALGRQLALVDLADAVNRIESVFVIDNRDPTVLAPACLDELRELLDWCDGSWKLDGNADLEAGLRHVRDALALARAPDAG
jgi:hypothetical protein